MSAIAFSLIQDSTRVPLFYVEADNSQANFFQINQRTLVIGQMLAAGSATAGVPILTQSAGGNTELFGAGSMLADMLATYRRNDSFGEVWALPLEDDAAGVAASSTVTFTGPATAAGTIALYIAGIRVRTGVASGDDATAIAAAVAAAVNAATTAVTAGSALGVVTLTARHKGEAGNDIDVRVNHYGEAGGERLPTGVGAAIVAMAGGATNPDLAAPLAALGDEPFDFVVLPYTDTPSLEAVEAEWGDATGRWSPNRQVYGHVFAVRRGTVGTLLTFGAGRNDPHVSVIGYDGSPSAPWQWAAALAGAVAPACRNDPARPFQTLEMRGIMAPALPDRPTLSERNSLLFGGITTWTVNVDAVRVERVITTYRVNAFGDPDGSYLDYNTLATLTEVFRRLRQRITSKFPRVKLANDGEPVRPGSATITPGIARAEMIALYAEMQELGLVENMEAFRAHLIVQRNADDPNRLDVLFPPDLVNQLRIFAVLAQFRLQYAA
jgi:phage tail sheath gpL-like